MLSGALCWLLGILLLVTGILASLYLVWLQKQRGVTGFSLLATSDALATVAISVAFLMNAALAQNSVGRIDVAQKQCDHGKLTLASALFLAPFVNAFMSTLAHAAETSHRSRKRVEARGWDAGRSPRVTTGIAAQWIIPLMSALFLFSAGVQRSHPFRSDTESCMQGTAVMPLPVESMEQCFQQEDISHYITSLMNNPNLTLPRPQLHRNHFLNKSDDTDNQTSLIVEKIYNILKESLKQQRNIRSTNESSKPTLIRQSEAETEPDYLHNYYNTPDDNQYYDKNEESEEVDTSTEDEPIVGDAEELTTEVGIITELPETYSESNSDMPVPESLPESSNTEQYVPIDYEEPETTLKPLHIEEKISSTSGFRPTDSSTIATVVTTVKRDTTTQKNTDSGLFEIQIPDTVNMCLIKCYLSEPFLQKYLFVLLFLVYFLPTVASIALYFSTPTMQQTEHVIEAKPSTASEDIEEEVGCTQQPVRATVMQSISTLLMWTPTLVETLLRVWFCIAAPQWLTTLLFVLAQAHAMIRNYMNVRLVRKTACSGTVQPVDVNVPAKLFTKVKAAILK